mmetsp:Transcript_8787/g.29341  ORF Transcript_8787/g.29341 Transcript_8787/m.29341 type:complete len:442 (-) Transcript_8787:507-1832(-)
MSRTKQWSIQGGLSSRPRPRTVLGSSEVNSKGLPKVVSFQDARMKHSHDSSSNSFDSKFMKYVRSRCPFPTTPMVVSGSYSQGEQSMLQHATPDSTLSTESIGSDALTQLTPQDYDAAEWKQRRDRSGRRFYVNRRDGRLSWTHPNSPDPEEEVGQEYGLVLPGALKSPKSERIRSVFRRSSPRVLEAGEIVSWPVGTHMVLRSEPERRRHSQSSNPNSPVVMHQPSSMSQDSAASANRFHRDYLRGLKLNFPPLDVERAREGVLSPNLARDQKANEAASMTALTPFGYVTLAEDAAGSSPNEMHGEQVKIVREALMATGEGHDKLQGLRAAIVDHFHPELFVESSSNTRLLQQEMFRSHSLNEKLEALRSCYDAGSISLQAFRFLKQAFLDLEDASAGLQRGWKNDIASRPSLSSFCSMTWFLLTQQSHRVGRRRSGDKK